MAKLYKYVGPHYLDKVFSSEGHVTLKCSYPKDFNDPYELFLTMDFNQEPDAVAFYAEVVGKLPQIPTTCFSRSPIVLPMWAHYAQNLEGFVIEFDEDALAQAFPGSGFGDVDYQDAADEDLSELLARAQHIGKYRYIWMLHKAVFSAAYYTKATCWSYEQERRMVVRESEARRFDNMILIDVPANCVNAIVCGPRASEKTADAVSGIAEQLGCSYFDLKIGKSSVVPFLVDSGGDPFVFDGARIVESEQSCGSCGEPVPPESAECAWCQITESHKSEAAANNPYRMLDRAGLLEDYLAGMAEIDRKHRDE